MSAHQTLQTLDARLKHADRMEAALKRIQAWDCLNPPDPKFCADHPWLKRLVDEALETDAEWKQRIA